MGTILAVGGSLRFSTVRALRDWRNATVASAELDGWEEPVPQPAEDASLDALSVGALLDRLAAGELAGARMALVEAGTLVRVAATFEGPEGCSVLAPLLLAALRRAAGLAKGEAVATYADGGNVLGVVLGKNDGTLAQLAEDDQVERALATPELVIALESLEPGDMAGRLRALAPPSVVKAAKAAKAATVAKVAKASKAAPAGTASKPTKPARKPRWRDLRLKTRSTFLACAPLASGELLILGKDGQWVRVNAKEETWTLGSVELPGDLLALATSGGRAWIGGEHGVFVSHDDGRSFTPGGAMPGREHAIGALVADGDVILAAEVVGRIFRSVDGGATFTCVKETEHEAGLVLGLSGMSRGAGARIVAVGLGGVVYVSEDLGATFTRARHVLDAALERVWIGGGKAFAVGMDRILVTPEGDAGALVYAGPKRDRDAHFTCVHGAGRAVWVSGWLGAIRTLDGGASWEHALTEEIAARGVYAFGEDHAVVFGTHGRVRVGRM